MKQPKTYDFIKCKKCGEELYLSYILKSDFDRFMEKLPYANVRDKCLKCGSELKFGRGCPYDFQTCSKYGFRSALIPCKRCEEYGQEKHELIEKLEKTHRDMDIQEVGFHEIIISQGYDIDGKDKQLIDKITNTHSYHRKRIDDLLEGLKKK